MKKILSLVAVMALMCIGSVFAANFEVHKYAQVTGDWVWDEGWTQPTPQPVTATYQMNAASDSQYNNWYQEYEELGQPWKYSLDAHVYMGGNGTVDNHFFVTTVNDPATTPAEDYTQYSFNINQFSEHSNSHLTVSGEGFVNVDTYFQADSYAQQDAYVRVNT